MPLTTNENDWLEQVNEIRRCVAAELDGRELPPAEEIIRQMREERGAHLLDLRPCKPPPTASDKPQNATG